MFVDEARFGRMNRPRSCWAPTGTRPEVAAQLIREYIYLYGAVSPKDGTCIYLIMPLLVPAQQSDFLARRSFPNARGPVARSRNNESPVGAEGSRAHNVPMSEEAGNLVAGRSFPNARGTIVRHRNDAQTIGAEGGGIHPTIVSAQPPNFLAGCRVPNAGGLVVRCRDNVCAIGAEVG